MATYDKQKKYINYQKGNLVLAHWNARWTLGEILGSNGSEYGVRLINSDQKVLCDIKSLFPINLSGCLLTLLGFKDHHSETGIWLSNGIINIIDISQQLEGLYGPTQIELEDDEDKQTEPDEPDPNQLLIENLVIYEAVNQPERFDITGHLTYNILFDYDGDWDKMRADQNAAREKRFEQHGPDLYEGFESYQDLIISTHSGYHVLSSDSNQILYESLVYNEIKSVLEGLLYLHELQNLYTDQLKGENLLLQEFIAFKINAERSQIRNE